MSKLTFAEFNTKLDDCISKYRRLTTHVDHLARMRFKLRMVYYREVTVVSGGYGSSIVSGGWINEDAQKLDNEMAELIDQLRSKVEDDMKEKNDG